MTEFKRVQIFIEYKDGTSLLVELDPKYTESLGIDSAFTVVKGSDGVNNAAEAFTDFSLRGVVKRKSLDHR